MTSDKTFFGHPRGLATLFFTEMWERFSYYGMRALLILFMVATVEKGGLGLETKTAGAIYGLYTMFVYLFSLPGGWLADKFFGLRKSVFYGGCIIALGHFCLAFPMIETFFLGLLLIILGTGLLKPTISSLVGELYTVEEPARRDAGFAIFYMGINIGGFISPLIVGELRTYNWHYGFAAAGLGMVLGLIQYKLTEKNLGSAGLLPEQLADAKQQQRRDRNIRNGLIVVSVVLTVFATLLFTRVIVINPIVIAQASGVILIASVVVYFLYLMFFTGQDKSGRLKLAALAIFFLTSAMFYSGYEQQGSSLNLFAERYTNLHIGTFRIRPEWFQSVPSLVVVLFVPLFAWLWVWLGKRKLNPVTPVKMSLGPIFIGLGFAVMMGGSMVVVGGELASPLWLILTFTFHTFGEICLYPTGMSATTKVAPKNLVGQLMGIWFMSLAFGNLIAGLYAGEFDKEAIEANPRLLVDLFGYFTKIMLVAGLIVLVFFRPIRKLMGDVR
jgi:proton-dependent oligopeptide transporter, POT family